MIKKFNNKAAFIFLFFGLFVFLDKSCDTAPDQVAEKEIEKDVKKEAEVLQKVEEDMGPQPWVFDIEEATKAGDNYRMSIWTGAYMQLVLMSLEPGEFIDLEVHNDHDQFFRIEKGEAQILMGKSKDDLYFDEMAYEDFAVMVPAGYWHQVINTGDTPLKLYTIYAPPEHPFGTVKKRY